MGQIGVASALSRARAVFECARVVDLAEGARASLRSLYYVVVINPAGFHLPREPFCHCDSMLLTVEQYFRNSWELRGTFCTSMRIHVVGFVA